MESIPNSGTRNRERARTYRQSDRLTEVMTIIKMTIANDSSICSM